MPEAVPPLTPADCDLRDFAFMPLDVVRLRDSDLVAMESAEAFRAAVMLWCASWHQLPAASLPDDDRVLANLAGYGRVVKEWQKERDGALRGWVLCTDGRLYHPVVAEKAVEAWRGKLERQWRTECARIKKFAQRHNVTIEPPDFDAWMSAGCPQGQKLNVPEDTPPLSMGQEPPCPTLVLGEMASKGQGEGQWTGTGTGTGTGTTLEGREPDGSGADKPRPSRPKREEITLKAYLQQCREQGTKAVPEDHPVRAYCRDLGASEEMVQVAWCVFRDDYTTGKGKDKRYKDWPTHFHNAVRKGWVKVWYAAGDGTLEWSQLGLQARKVLDERQRGREAGNA